MAFWFLIGLRNFYSIFATCLIDLNAEQLIAKCFFLQTGMYESSSLNEYIFLPLPVQQMHLFPTKYGGGSEGAMVLGKLPVPGRPTNVD